MADVTGWSVTTGFNDVGRLPIISSGLSGVADITFAGHHLWNQALFTDSDFFEALAQNGFDAWSFRDNGVALPNTSSGAGSPGLKHPGHGPR